MRNFKIFICLLVCAAVLVVNAKMTDFLYPNNEMRVVVHKIQTADYDTLIIGNSHGQCGIDPVALEQFGGMHAINAASGNEFVIDAYYLVRLAAQSTDLKTVIYEIDSAYWMLDEAENCELVKVYHEFPPSKLKFRQDRFSARNEIVRRLQKLQHRAFQEPRPADAGERIHRDPAL